MATECPDSNSCNTDSPGWLIERHHPGVTDGIVTRRVCFHLETDCCKYTKDIKVINCGDYYIYYLNGTPDGCFRYCTK